MEITNAMLQGMLDEAKKTKTSLVKLKMFATRCQQFELAANLRDLELELFPDSPEVKVEKEMAGKTRTTLGMVGLNCSDDVAWLIHKTMGAYFKKKGKFSIDEASELMAKRETIFGKPEPQQP